VANGIVLLLIMIFLPRGLVDPRAIRLRKNFQIPVAQTIKDPSTSKAGVVK
jgi:hypothetical protein